VSAATTRLLAWLAGRTPRERVLLAGAAATVALALLGLAAAAVQSDLAALRARVEGHARQYEEVRRLAAALRAGDSAVVEPADGGSLVAYLETAAAGVVGRERIAGMTPAIEPVEEGVVEERVTVRVTGATLTETVAFLHALEAERPHLGVTRVELRKHPDDAARFDALLDVARLRRTE